jgi:hypothetical protein
MEKEKENEVTRFLNCVRPRLVVLMSEAENFGHRDDRADHIIKGLIADYNYPFPAKN